MSEGQAYIQTGYFPVVQFISLEQIYNDFNSVSSYYLQFYKLIDWNV